MDAWNVLRNTYRIYACSRTCIGSDANPVLCCLAFERIETWLCAPLWPAPRPSTWLTVAATAKPLALAAERRVRPNNVVLVRQASSRTLASGARSHLYRTRLVAFSRRYQEAPFWSQNGPVRPSIV